MNRFVDLDERVTAQFYDEECEEWTMRTVTIEDVLDSVCDDYTVLPSAQPEKMQLSKEDATKGTTFNCIDRKVAIDALDALCDRECEYSKQQRSFMCGACRLGSAFDVIDELPPAQPERTCVNCGRTANNGGWYADGGTRCPIEEHYALPKDGYCHLWEKRNVTDDDYPERRTDE